MLHSWNHWACSTAVVRTVNLEAGIQTDGTVCRRNRSCHWEMFLRTGIEMHRHKPQSIGELQCTNLELDSLTKLRQTFFRDCVRTKITNVHHLQWIRENHIPKYRRKNIVNCEVTVSKFALMFDEACWITPMWTMPVALEFCTYSSANKSAQRFSWTFLAYQQDNNFNLQGCQQWQVYNNLLTLLPVLLTKKENNQRSTPVPDALEKSS